MITISYKQTHSALSVLAGGLMTLAMSPFHLYPIAFVSILAFYCLLERANVHGNTHWSTGWYYGLGFWGAGVSWIYISISEYGYTPLVVAPFLFFIFIAFMALFHASQGWLYGKLKTKHHAFSFVLLWVIFEWLRQWVLNGFPWLYAGNAFNNTVINGYAPIFGVYGISLVVVITALLPIFIKRYIVWLPAPLIFILWLIGYFLQDIQWTEPQDTVSVALVQGNIAQEKKWEESHLMNTLKVYDRLSQPNWDADITLWPEAAIPMFFSDMKPFIKKEQDYIVANQSTLITGIPYDTIHDNKRIFYNGMISLSPNMTVYKKQKLVPFGEYIPLSNALKAIAPFIPIEDFSAGDSKQRPLTYRFDKKKFGFIGTFICFETAYPNVVAKLARKSDMLATVSNDAWFGRSHGPHQHLQLAQMRALENQKYIIRSTNNGITAIINHKGQITDRIPQDMEGVLVGEATRRVKSTPFSILGNYPIIIFCFLSLTVLIYQNKPWKLKL